MVVQRLTVSDQTNSVLGLTMCKGPLRDLRPPTPQCNCFARVLYRRCNCRVHVDRHRGDTLYGDAHEQSAGTCGNTSILFPRGPHDVQWGVQDCNAGGYAEPPVTYTVTYAAPAHTSTTAVRNRTCRSRWVFFGSWSFGPRILWARRPVRQLYDYRARPEVSAGILAYRPPLNLLRPGIPVPVVRDRPKIHSKRKIKSN